MFRFRLRVICILMFGGVLMVSTRLFYLQIVEGDTWQTYAEQIRLSRRSCPTYRGRLLAADGTVLAVDLPAFDIGLKLSDLDKRFSDSPSRRMRIGALRFDLHHALRVDNQGVRDLQDLNLELGQTPEGQWCIHISYSGVIRRRTEPPPVLRLVWRGKHVDLPVAESRTITIEQHILEPVNAIAEMTDTEVRTILLEVVRFAEDMLRKRINSWDTRSIIRDVPYEVVVQTMVESEIVRGFVPVERRVRRYNEGDLAGHVIGYMTSLNPEEYRMYSKEYDGSRAKRYFLNDTIGRAGFERVFNETLRGARGEELIEKDRHGRTIKVLQRIDSVPGSDIQLTILPQQQRAAEEALKDRVGAIVVLDVRTGEVLVLASSPRYNPGSFSSDFRELVANPDNPLLHRAVSNYPLGSTFKVITSLAGWSSGMNADTAYRCEGSFRIGGLRCSARWGHGEISFHEAMTKSCNVYFCEIGAKVGAEKIAEWGEKFGFGMPSGIEVPGERGGYVPSPGRRMWERGERWYGGDTANYSVGQGDLLVTPLQAARMLSAVATGNLTTPHIVKRIIDAHGNEQPVPGRSPIETVRIDMPAGAQEALRASLTAVAHDRGGTAYAAFRGWERSFKVAGKTSTAQRKKRDPLTGEVVPNNVGWFVGFAPADNPRIAFAVAIEDLEAGGPGGGAIAAPLARQVIESFPDDFLKATQGQGR